MTEFDKFFKSSGIMREVKDGQIDQSNYTKKMQIFLFNNGLISLKYYGKLANVDKILYDVSIQDNIEKDELPINALKRIFKKYTSIDIKLNENNQDINRCIYTPRIYVDHKAKEIIYVYFIKYQAQILEELSKQDVVTFITVDIDEFLKLFYSNNYKKYNDSYKELVRLGLCEVFGVEEYKKADKYHRIAN